MSQCGQQMAFDGMGLFENNSPWPSHMSKRQARLLNYYGGKSRSASRYPAPLHDVIVEPFSGGAGFATYHRHKKVFLFEKDTNVFSAINFVIKSKPDEILSLPLIEPGQSVDDLDCPDAAKKLIGFWLNGGSAAPCKKLSRWGVDNYNDGDVAASYWGTKCRQRIATLAGEIKHWEIINQSYDTAPDIEACWFIDPPYQDKGSYYKHSAKNIDFTHLGSWCKSRKGQVIVCENMGADWLPFVPFFHLAGAAKSQDSRLQSLEAIYYLQRNDLSNFPNQPNQYQTTIQQ